VACLPLCASFLAAAGEPITVLNPGFESPAMEPCIFTAADAWIENGTGGAWRPGLGGECFHNGYPNGVPEGQQIGFINNGSNYLSQTLSAVLESNTKYTLSVAVGRRQDCCQMISYKVQLLANNVLLVEDPGLLDPEPGTFETSVICFTTGASHPELGAALEIRLKVDGGVQANFDDVHLEKSPPEGECGPPAGVSGDLDGDGDVDGSDLGLLLGAWGPCGNCSACAADLNGDCTVDGGDLGALLGDWG